MGNIAREFPSSWTEMEIAGLDPLTGDQVTREELDRNLHIGVNREQLRHARERGLEAVALCGFRQVPSKELAGPAGDVVPEDWLCRECLAIWRRV